MEKYVVDGLMLLIFGATVLYFGKRGFALTVMTAVVTVGAVILAKLFGALVGAWLCDAFVESYMVDLVRMGLDSVLDKLTENMDPQQLLAALPEQVSRLLELIHFDVNSLAQNLGSGMDIGALAQQIGAPLAKAVSETLGVLLTFLVSLVGLKILSRLVDGIFHLPILSGINGFLGVMLGVVIGFCACLIAANLFHVAVTLLSAKNPALGAYVLPEGSVLYRWFLELRM